MDAGGLKSQQNTSCSMADEMKYWREASTVILAARPTKAVLSALQSGSSSSRTTRPEGHQYEEDYKVLMLKRSGKSSFMPSRMVFPGGSLNDVDHSRAWSDLFYKLTKRSLHEATSRFLVTGPRAPMTSEKRPEWSGTTPDITFRICGIREAFEEAGLLLALTGEEITKVLDSNKSHLLHSVSQGNELEQSELTKWRKLVNSDPNAFLTMCTELKKFPNIWALHEWNNWLTPVFRRVERPSKNPMRFDTMFYICCFECDQLPDTSADEKETVSSEWKRPSEFLLPSADDKLTIDVPQGYELRRLLHFPSIQQLNKFSAERSTKGLLRYMPVVRVCQDGFVSYMPGDYAYPESPDFEGTKEDFQMLPLNVTDLIDETKTMHRYVFDKTNMEAKFLCNRPLPCGHLTPLESKHPHLGLRTKL